MTRTNLRCAVQYAVEAQDWLPRWRLRRWAQAACADEPREVVFTLRLVDEAEGRELNRTFRGKDYATNILTFPMHDPTAHHAPIEADLVLCIPVLLREAEEQNKPALHHAAHLVIHGSLHARGFDHETEAEAEKMEQLETALLARFGIADPYHA